MVTVFGVLALMPHSAKSESKATKDEIKAAFVGKTVAYGNEGEATYDPDGKYSYRAASGRITPGTYDIIDGQICVTFRGGNFRCDTIVKEGNSFALINRSGTKYPATIK